MVMRLRSLTSFLGRMCKNFEDIDLKNVSDTFQTNIIQVRAPSLSSLAYPHDRTSILQLRSLPCLT
jgi:hypothetical protein